MNKLPPIVTLIQPLGEKTLNFGPLKFLFEHEFVN